jgi:magnesium-transporting ATPase (P-type)
MAFHWKVLIAVVLVALLVGVVVAILVEWRSAKKWGGFKAWVTDVPTVNYRTVRMGYLSEVVVAYLTVAIIARSVWPTVFSELQIEAIWAIFTFLGAAQAFNVTAFIGKRATANPEMVAATAAANAGPDVLPTVVTKTTETTAKKDSSSSTTVTPVVNPSDRPADKPLPPQPLAAAPAPTNPAFLEADD